MFSYFGSKSKIVKHYPKPLYDTIIEPFAGSAQYAFLHWQKQVILVEKDKRIYDVWDWLINEATFDFVMSLPLFQPYEKIVYSNPVIQRLISLECRGGTTGFRLTAGSGNYNRWSEKEGRGRKRIADNLHKIKHWKIIHGDYSLASPNIEATWFIDPPYDCKAGTGYKHSSIDIDYNKLGQWCRDRKGQTIVCEDLGALWLPFKYFMEGNGLSAGKRKDVFIEGIWTNEYEP